MQPGHKSLRASAARFLEQGLTRASALQHTDPVSQKVITVPHIRQPEVSVEVLEADGREPGCRGEGLRPGAPLVHAGNVAWERRNMWNWLIPDL